MDPITGELFNVEIAPSKIDSVNMRLKVRPEDEEEVEVLGKKKEILLAPVPVH